MATATDRARATVNQLMDRYLQVLAVEPTTRGTYEGYIRKHIRPLVGGPPVGRLDGETLDSCHPQLRTVPTNRRSVLVRCSCRHTWYAGPKEIAVWEFNGHEGGGLRQNLRQLDFLDRVLGRSR